MFQQSNESFKYYIERFRHEINNVENRSDESILIAIFVGLQKDGKLYESIYKSPVRDLCEFYERATKKIRWEETFDSKKPTNQKDKARSTNQSKKRGNGDKTKGVRGKILMIRSLRKQGTNKGASNLHAKVAMRTTVSYPTPKTRSSLLRRTRRTSEGLTP